MIFLHALTSKREEEEEEEEAVVTWCPARRAQTETWDANITEEYCITDI